jgi:hypothetical protein
VSTSRRWTRTTCAPRSRTSASGIDVAAAGDGVTSTYSNHGGAELRDGRGGRRSPRRSPRARSRSSRATGARRARRSTTRRACCCACATRATTSTASIPRSRARSAAGSTSNRLLTDPPASWVDVLGGQMSTFAGPGRPRR